jgi:hypothetical protein
MHRERLRARVVPVLEDHGCEQQLLTGATLKLDPQPPVQHECGGQQTEKKCPAEAHQEGCPECETSAFGWIHDRTIERAARGVHDAARPPALRYPSG